MRVMYDAVEDAVGECGIADLLMPFGHRQLRSEDQRPRLITVFANLPKIAALRFGKRRHGPVVDQQDVDAAEPRQQSAETAIGARDGEIAKQRGCPCVISRVSVTASFMRQRRSKVALAYAGWSQHENVFVLRHPLGFLRQ